MENWLDCLRSRKVPTALIEVCYVHSIGARMVFDPEKRFIREG